MDKNVKNREVFLHMQCCIGVLSSIKIKGIFGYLLRFGD